MPITAYLGSRAIISTELSEAEFDGLRVEAQLQFRCGVRAIPRRSSAGFPHFYHQSLAECDFPHTNPETDEHRAIKSSIIRGALAAGWSAEEEFPNDDRTWVADVLVTNGVRNIAFEAQWSKQDDEQFRHRTDRYKEARLETVWLYQHANPAETARHGIIPVQKRIDGVIVTHGAGHDDELTIEQAVEAILRRTAWWKFSRPSPQLIVHRWSAVPCLGCGVVNVRSLSREQRIACSRCLQSVTERMAADPSQARVAAAEAGLPETANPVATACGACEYEIGRWAIDVAEKVANFTHVRRGESLLGAHWCFPGHTVGTYADAVAALSALPAPRPASGRLQSTPETRVREEIAEVKRRLDKGAQSIRDKQRKREFLASPEGERWRQKKRYEEQSRRDKEAHRLGLELAEKRSEEEARWVVDFENGEAARKAAGKRTIRETHEVTMLFRSGLKQDGSAARLLVEKYGQLAERCHCADCESFRSGLSAHTTRIFFAT